VPVHPLRAFRHDPRLAIAIASTLALGVGVATGLYGYLDSFLHPRVAAPHARYLASVRNLTPRGPLWSSSSIEFEAIRRAGAFDRLAAHTAVNVTLTTDAGPLFSWGQLVLGDFFELHGGRAARGRLLRPSDDSEAAAPVVVLSHRLWRTAFAADPAVVGRSLRINHQEATVVGVAARDFEGVSYASEFFVPARLGDRLTGLPRSTNPQDRWLLLQGRVADDAASGSGWERARTALAAVAAALDAEQPLPDGEKRTFEAAPATAPDPETLEDPFFEASRLLAAAAILFALLGAANLAGLLLAKTTAREREWAVRKALGASRPQLAIAILSSLLPPAVAGLLGSLAVAKWVELGIEKALVSPMSGIGPAWVGENAQVFDLDLRGLAFAGLTTAILVAGAALPPLVRVLRRDPNRALRATSAGGGQADGVLAPRRILVVVQLALAVTLLTGSGLLVRTLNAAGTADLGFNPTGLIYATVNLPRTAGGARDDLLAYVRLLERARGLGGVRHATLALLPPLGPNSRSIDAARPSRPEESMSLRYNIVASDYFEMLGVPMVAGRALDGRDTPDAPAAVVVSASLAQRLWGTAPAVGQVLHLTGPKRVDEAGPDFVVVGVARDAAFVEPTQPHQEMLFFAYGQRRHSRMTLVTRSEVPQATLEPQLREAIRGTRDDASLIDLLAAREQLRRTLQPYRLNASVGAGLALAGLITSLTGLLALQLYTLQLRRRELAVRVALGATPRQISRGALREALRPAAIGILVGVASAAATVGLLGKLLYGVEPFDPYTFVAVPLVLAATVLLASWWPARRAAQVDPAESLRAL
jgi:predicted permease